ncbi:hypothetical protein F2981_15685 [Sinorhizobium meliloti]|nr:hypothetical protein [Sinorhizobium meliloti]
MPKGAQDERTEVARSSRPAVPAWGRGGKEDGGRGYRLPSVFVRQGEALAKELAESALPGSNQSNDDLKRLVDAGL